MSKEQKRSEGAFGLPKTHVRKIAAQLVLLMGISVALGFSFNSSNPIGIRFAAEQASSQPTIDVKPLPQDFKPVIQHQPNSFALAPVTELTSHTASVPGRIVHISLADVKRHLPSGKVLLVDARPKVNYDHGHIPGAVSLPYAADPKFSATPADYEAFQQQYPKDTPIVTYCTTKTCQLSQIVAEKLVNEYGYTNVRKMDEGYLEYTEAESGTNSPPVHTANVEPLVKDPTAAGKVQHVEWSAVKPLLAAKKAIIVDARPKVNYDHGHIPGAVSLPYAADPKFSSKPEDFEAFQKAYSKETPIVVYCTTKSCQLSQIIAEKLVELGYRNVSKMNQGFLEYTEAEGASAGETAAHAFGDVTVANSPVAASEPVKAVANSATSAATSPTQVTAQSAPTPSSSASVPVKKPFLNPSRTSWAEVKPLLESGQIVLVDVRQAPTFELGHIPGAVNLSYTSQEPAYQAFMQRYPKDAHIVMYCTDIGCPLSTKMSEILVTRYGYEHVQHMTEGYAEWQRINTLEAKAK